MYRIPSRRKQANSTPIECGNDTHTRSVFYVESKICSKMVKYRNERQRLKMSKINAEWESYRGLDSEWMNDKKARRRKNVFVVKKRTKTNPPKMNPGTVADRQFNEHYISFKDLARAHSFYRWEIFFHVFETEEKRMEKIGISEWVVCFDRAKETKDTGSHREYTALIAIISIFQSKKMHFANDRSMNLSNNNTRPVSCVFSSIDRVIGVPFAYTFNVIVNIVA